MRGGRWYEPDGGERKIRGGKDGNGGRKRMKKGERKEYSANSSSPKQEYHIRKDLL